MIRTRSEQLLRQFADYSPVHTALEEIQQAAAAADRITRRLADLGAAPPGQIEILSLNGILRRMAKFIQSIAGDQIAVTIRPGAGIAKIYANAGHTEELIMQLVLHAVKAMPGGGQLGLDTAADGDQVSLSVTHTGTHTDSDSVNLSLVRYLTSDGNRLEAFFPQWTDLEATAGAPPTLLLLIGNRASTSGQSCTTSLRARQVSNLLEAEDDEQADTLLDLHEVDLVIGGNAERETVPFLRLAPPYTEQQLLEQVRARLDPPLTFSAST